nr:MAG: nonstructural protein [Microvirus sp.]
MKMRHSLYSVQDIKLKSFDSPFPSANDDTAMRLFRRMVENIPTMKDNPEDFKLYNIGAYDLDTGELLPSTLQYTCSGLDLVNKPATEPSHETSKVSNDPSIQPST